jgi:hypothetical protein
MKHFALLVTWLAMSVPLLLLAEEKSVDQEAFGKLRWGQKEETVLQILGKPQSKGKDTEWAAIGEWVQEWNYPSLGLQLDMASAKKGGAKTLLNISASAGCVLTTARGIGIGSSEAAVRKAYRELEEKDHTKRGETFVAGSIYGGVIFQFQDGKVVEIFLGAAAE